MDMNSGFADWDSVECDAFGRLNGLTATRHRATGAARRLLVPVDGSPASLDALRLALRLADGGGTEVHLLNAQSLLGTEPGDDTLLRRGLEDTRAARTALAASGRPYVLRLVAGMPGQAILAYAGEHGVAEIVMGADGAGGVACALLGSVAMDVLENAWLPVTLVKSGGRAGRPEDEGDDWLVACDGSESSLRALRHALAHLAGRHDGARLHLLNVRTPPGSFSGTPPATDEETLGALHAEARAECAAALSLLEAAGIGYDCRVAIGDPVARILETAEDLGCAHIAMGTRGLGWLGGVLLGSISAGVLRRTPLPLTLVR